MSAVFVTGTGTDVGKTFVSAALVRHWRDGSRPVDAIKPLVSGFDATTAATSDPGVLLAALGRPGSMAEIERISPWRFAAPMSPDLAAAREGRTLDFKALVAFCREAQAAAAHGMLLIEGVGGVMVPLDETHTVLDWMTALRLPVLLVTGSYLGTISHTLTALHVLAQRNLDIAAVVVSESPLSGAPLDDTVATITRFADSIEVVGVRRLADDRASHPAFARIASLITG
jgi:dethiobiotin synthetase